MRDFSLNIYRVLLEAFQWKGYRFITFADYCKLYTNAEERKHEKYVILRHDVDRHPQNALRMAQVERSQRAKGTFYFRVGKESNQPEVIRTIAALGNEIGYHYEDMQLCKGKIDQAWEHFKVWLGYFRLYYPVETICMHGVPFSKYDGRELWKKYDYHQPGIIGEPYMDTDFSDVLYLTDTGRCWDGFKIAVRDKINEHQAEWCAKGWVWHSTKDLIRAIETDQLPPHVMLTTHPQRWTNHKFYWWRELIWQNAKNVVKWILTIGKR